MGKTPSTRESASFRHAFIGQAQEPTDLELAVTLGAVKPLWDQLIDELTREYKLTREWNSYSLKAGWSLRLKREARNIVYLSPSKSGLMASFALSDTATQTARASRFSKHVLKIISEAKKYAEGTAVRIVVSGPADVAVVKMLAKIKLENGRI